MRVICITLENFSGASGALGTVMQVGDEFNVVGEVMGRGKNGNIFPCWDLEPFAHTLFVFDKRNFATLPDEPAEVIEEQEPEYATA